MTDRLKSARAAWVAVAVAVVLVAAAMIVPRLTGEDVRVNFPPLHADWDPRIGVLTIPAVVVGLLMVVLLPRLVAASSWRRTLLIGFAAMWLWTMAVAITEGPSGLSRVLDPVERPGEYVYDAQRVDDVFAMLREFISRIPMDATDNWRTHVAGHPPGALLVFVLFDRLGITNPFWIGVVVVTIGSTAIVAVLQTLKVLGSEKLARAAVPWIALAPVAVYMGVNGDAVFTAVAAWGLCLLAIATRVPRHRVPAGIGAGLLLGFCVYLSYGLVLLGILALAVLWIGRTWKALPWALGGALAVAAAFTALGFAWWEAYPVLRERYYDGIASDRAYWYWVWANVGAWTFTVGLAVWAAFPRAVAAMRGAVGPRQLFSQDRAAQTVDETREDDDAASPRDRTVLAALAAAAIVTILAATLSGMSKAEVERIWMPFTIWVLALPLLLPRRWHRPLLVSQVATTLLVQQLLLTRW